MENIVDLRWLEGWSCVDGYRSILNYLSFSAMLFICSIGLKVPFGIRYRASTIATVFDILTLRYIYKIYSTAASAGERKVPRRLQTLQCEIKLL